MSSLVDKAHLLFYAKWVAFIVCTTGFVWKVSGSFASYLCKETGTKTDLKANYEIDFPGLAVCRHPHQIANLEDAKNGSQSLERTYNLTLAHLKYLEPYRVNRREGLGPLLSQFLFNDSACIRGLTVASRGLYARASQPNLSSRPATHPNEWPSFFHPIFGTCYQFQPAELLPLKYVGTAGIEYMKVNIDFDHAFPFVHRSSDEDAQMSMEELQKSIMNSVGEDQVLVMIYDRGSFLTSLEVALLSASANEVFSLQQEVVDRSNTKDLYGCHDYTHDYTEDDCLFDCLAHLFIQEFGCLHARLSLMPIHNETLKATRACLLEDLEEKTRNYSQHINRGLKFQRSVEEYGLIRIRQILAEFNQEDLEPRCGCKLRCTRNIISVAKWPSQTAERHKSTNATTHRENHKFAIFQFQPYLKVYSSHMLYTGSDLVADIGGYLGLFLGLSAFGLVELLEKVLLEKAAIVVVESSTNSMADANKESPTTPDQ